MAAGIDRHRRALLAIAAVSLVILVALLSRTPHASVAQDLLASTTLRYNLRPCGFRKQPMVMLGAERWLHLVWELSCRPQDGTRVAICAASSPASALARDCQIGAYVVDADPQFVSAANFLFSVELAPREYPDGAVVAVHAGDWVSEAVLVARPPAGPASAVVRLGLVSDSQNGAVMFSRILARLASHAPAVDLLVHGGDFVQSRLEKSEWETLYWWPITKAFKGPRRPPIALVRGNHDGDAAVSNRYSSREQWYAFTVAGVRVVVLDSNRDFGDQLPWFAAEVASPAWTGAAARVVFCHIPPFVEFWEVAVWKGREDKWNVFVREKYAPMWEAAGVDLVVGGHSHLYQRGKRNGVVYAIVGGGGGALETADGRVEDYGFYEVTRIDFHYTILEINSPASAAAWRLRLTAYDPSGNAFDVVDID